ncbi:MAG TPA: ABC transporter permease [Bacteroidota bacterium]|nr:ABC transporter permease [Bacteroidota bacterium]
MLKNYFAMAFRNLLRHRVFSFINVAGLAAGMACTILILLWAQDELSYDRFFKDSDRISLVVRGDRNGMNAVTSSMLAPALKEELPEIKKSTSVMQLPASFKFLIQNGDKGFEENVVFARSGFFDFFSLSLSEGNPATALDDPNSILLDRETAQKYFGSENAVGKSLTVSGFGGKSAVKVSGILEGIPPQSHIRAHIILPMQWFKSIGINFETWFDQSFHTYIETEGNVDADALSSKIRQCEIRHFPQQNADNLSYALLPLTKIHLFSGHVKFLEGTGDIAYVRIFIAIAVVILLIAGINYMNLSTALSLKRRKEIAVKKTIGASRRRLMAQFLGESLITSSMAFVLALLVVELFLPEFNTLSGKTLSVRYGDPSFIFISLAIISGTGLASGFYPALLLSSFSPVQILRKRLPSGSGGALARSGLVIFQFAASIGIIVCTIVISNQLSFVMNSNLGFDKENLLCIRLTSNANTKFESMKNELEKDPDVITVSRSEPVSTSLTRTEGITWEGKPANEQVHFWVLHTDDNLAATYKFQIVQGRFFSDQYPTDRSGAFVINEAAAKTMGFTAPLNKEVALWGKRGKIVGVVRDFHFASFRTAIEPLIFNIPDSNQFEGRYQVMSLRIRPGNPQGLISVVEQLWQKEMGSVPLEYYFYDDSLNKQYSSDFRMRTIFQCFSFISIMIACLGLFGLASISAEQRTKEVGIRKVLGASITDVVFTLSKDFMTWVVLSNLVAIPVAWYFMSKWLEDFAYRIPINWWMFGLAAAFGFAIALLTVGAQAMKAATANPVESLRYE